MWWWVALTAVELQVEVIPDRPAVMGERDPVVRAPPVPVGSGVVHVDGRLDEAAWAGPGVPLEALDAGPRPPGSSLRVVLSPDGLVIGLRGLPADHGVTLAVDPDGLGQTWWEVEIGAKATVTRRCTLADLVVPVEWAMPDRAVPCGVIDAFPVAGEAGVRELMFPWARMQAASSRMRLMWAQTGPRGQGGTWAVNGSADAIPALGRLLDLPQPPGRAVVRTDVEAGTWSVTVPGRGAIGSWAWSRWYGGRRIDSGLIEVTAGGLTFDLPDLAMDAVAVELRREGDPVDQAYVERVRRRLVAMSLGTPIYDEVIEAAWELPDARSARVELSSMEGEVLGAAVAELPAGGGLLRVRVPEGWGTVRVRVDELLDRVAVRAAGPGEAL